MGWTFTGHDRKNLIKERIEDKRYCVPGKGLEINPNKRAICLANTARGNVLWTVWSVQTRESGRDCWNETHRYIGCDLLMNGGNDGWGYKDMDESVGPCYYTCPPKYLDMVPVENANWRENVLVWHESRRVKTKFKDGDTLEFNAPFRFRDGLSEHKFLVVNKRQGLFRGLTNGGNLYRLRRKDLGGDNFTVIAG